MKEKENYEEICKNNELSFHLLGFVLGPKKIQILRYLVKNRDEDSLFKGTYKDIMKDVNVSKPTVVSFFTQMIEIGAIKKIKNSVYKLNSN